MLHSIHLKKSTDCKICLTAKPSLVKIQLVLKKNLRNFRNKILGPIDFSRQS